MTSDVPGRPAADARAARLGMRPLRLVALLLALTVAACGVAPGSSPASSGPVAPANALRGGDFDEAKVDEVVRVLADSGIGTFESPEAANPLREVTAPASPSRLLLDQVRAMALEAHAGGGIEGAEIDALFEVPPDLAPPSYVLAGYVAAVDTPGAQLARTLMGVEDWTVEQWRATAPSMVYPKLVLTLFTSDIARARQADAASAAGNGRGGEPPEAHRDLAGRIALARTVVPPPRFASALAAGGPCSAVTDWISGALKAVFDGLKLGESSSTIGSIFTSIWNFVVNVLEVVITALVKKFEQYVLDWIGRVAAIVGTVSMVISWVQPWTATVQAVATTEKGVPGLIPTQEGMLVARVAVPANGDWPGWAADCAAASGHPLPNMRPEGTPVIWSEVIQNPPGLVAPGTPEQKLDAQGVARLPFTTLIDDVKNPFTQVPGAVFVHATFERQALREFAEFLQKELWLQLPEIVVGPLQSFLQKPLAEVNERLGAMISVAASGPGVVVFHVQQATPPPEPPPPPPPAGQGGGDFCNRYRAYVDWATALGPDTDMTQDLAVQIAERFLDMYPVAPAEMKNWVALVYLIYATFGKLEEPANLPATGYVGIERLPEALMSMHAYCGIPWPAG